jgi:hypothetical protein
MDLWVCSLVASLESHRQWCRQLVEVSYTVGDMLCSCNTMLRYPVHLSCQCLAVLSRSAVMLGRSTPVLTVLQDSVNIADVCGSCVGEGQFHSTGCACVCAPAGFGAAAFMAPLLQNLCLSMGDNEEACFCLKVREHYVGARGGGCKCTLVQRGGALHTG